MKLTRGMKQFGALLLAVCLIACLWAAPAQAVMVLNLDYGAFVDLPKVAWYSDYMKKALEEHFFYGVSMTHFDPDRAITRGEAVTVLSRLYESLSDRKIPDYGGVSTFSDVAANRFYSNPVAWAQVEGIATGLTEDTFGPENPVTQQELAVMIDKFLDAYDSTSRRPPAYKVYENEDGLTDLDLTGAADWAAEAVYNISGYGVFGAAHWNPTAPALRGECSRFFVRLYEQIVADSGTAVPRLEYRYAFPEGSVDADFAVVPNGVAAEGKDSIGSVRLIQSYEEYQEILSRVESFCQPAAVRERLTVDESTFSGGKKLIAVEIKNVGMPDFHAELASSGTLQSAGKFTFSCEGYAGSDQEDITGQIFFVEVPRTVTDAKSVICSMLHLTEDVQIVPTPTPIPEPIPESGLAPTAEPSPTPDATADPVLTE